MARVAETVVSEDATDRDSDPCRPLLLTIPQAATVLSVGRTTVYQLIWAGKLTPIYIGRCVRLARSDLEDFVAGLLPADR